MLDTPGSFTSARGETAARDKYYTDLVGQRKQVGQQKQADLTAWAKNLASEWLKQPRPSSQTPVVTTPTTAPKTATSTAPTNNYKSPFVPYGVPNPAAPTPPAAAPAAAKKRTGGKQPGVLSQTPNAIRKRNSRAAAAAAPGKNAFGQMAQTLSGANKSTSSTGGTTTQMPTGLVHTANPKATTPAAASVAKPAPNWLTPTTKISKPVAGKPTADEYAKLQQRIAAASAKQQGVTEAFSDLPGAKPAAGGAVPASVTARPAMKALPPLQSRYAQNFKTWAASKVADKSSGLGLTDVEKMPGMSRTLNQALAQIVTTQQNPNDNIAAVEQYFLTVGQAMQKLSAEQKGTQQQNNPKQQQSASVTPLSAILNPKQIDALKDMAKDPTGAYDIKTTLGLR
jgi:hypothetical protein